MPQDIRYDEIDRILEENKWAEYNDLMKIDEDLHKALSEFSFAFKSFETLLNVSLASIMVGNSRTLNEKSFNIIIDMVTPINKIKLLQQVIPDEIDHNEDIKFTFHEVDKFRAIRNELTHAAFIHQLEDEALYYDRRKKKSFEYSIEEINKLTDYLKKIISPLNAFSQDIERYYLKKDEEKQKALKERTDDK